MVQVFDQVYFDDGIRPIDEAQLSIASSAVLYGLSVYTVLPVHKSEAGTLLAFRITDHYQRLIQSARIMGIDTFEQHWSQDRFQAAVQSVIHANTIDSDVFVRATVHVSEHLPGTRSRGLQSVLSIFVYTAEPLLPPAGARLKTSVWRRIPDYAIPSRAKVNGAYVNSVLAKQDAIDSGYDDCVFLDASGHVCESSAANIFIVRDGVLITPNNTSDLLEGISRRTILELARGQGIECIEREVDLTELYVADEVFLCGTSAYITPITAIDARPLGAPVPGPITKQLQQQYRDVLHGKNTALKSYVTELS